MQVTRTDNSATKVTLAISANADDLAPIKNHVLRHFIDQVKVPGFREGKAPMNMVEKHANPEKLNSEFLEHAINDLFQQAIRAQKLRPVGQPDVQLKKFVPYTTLEFSAKLEVVGAVKLANYKSIKLPKPKANATAADVNAVIKSLQERSAERQEVRRAAKDGDEVVIDFAGKDADDQPVAGADGKDHPLVLGSKSFIPGFEDNVVGLKAGESKDFSVTFPKDYGAAALQNKKVTFSVTAKKISELVEPKLDDAFAAAAGPFKNLAELKADVKKQALSEKQYQAGQAYQNELIKLVTDKSSVEIPELLIEDQLNHMEQEEKRNLTYRGQTWPEHLKAEGVTEQQHREKYRTDATDRVKAGLVLSEISEQEGLDVTPEEIDIRIQILKAQYQDPAMQAELDKPENRRDIVARMLTEKTIQKLVDYASK